MQSNSFEAALKRILDLDGFLPLYQSDFADETENIPFLLLSCVKKFEKY